MAYHLRRFVFFDFNCYNFIFIFRQRFKICESTDKRHCHESSDRDHIFPTQQGNTGAMDCFDKLMDSLKAGNLDFNQLRESMEKCFTMNFNEDGNNTDILPNPQDGNEPRFIVT